MHVAQTCILLIPKAIMLHQAEDIDCHIRRGAGHSRLLKALAEWAVENNCTIHETESLGRHVKCVYLKSCQDGGVFMVQTVNGAHFKSSASQGVTSMQTL